MTVTKNAGPLALLFLALAWVTYSNTFQNPFTMDDYALIVHQPPKPSLSQFQLDILKTPKAGLKTHYLYFRPLSHFIPWLEARMFGPHPAYYHLFSLLVFYLCALVLWDTMNCL